MSGLRPMWAVMDVDELLLRRLEHGEEITRSLKETGSIANLIGTFSTPTPSVVVSCTIESFSVSVSSAEPATQLELSAVAQRLGSAGWNVGNSYRQLNPRRILKQYRTNGSVALRAGAHWWIRRYRSPLIVRREEQRYQQGFDKFVHMTGPSSLDPVGSRTLSLAELGKLSETAIGSTLNGEEASRYHRDRR